MKPFTIAGALAAGTLKPTDTIYCEHGVYQVGGSHRSTTRTSTTGSRRRRSSRKSSNIGALKIGLAARRAGALRGVPPLRLRRADRAAAPGRGRGRAAPAGARPWFDAETATASFGQGISVTTLQLAMAMSAIANGGQAPRADPRASRSPTVAATSCARRASHVRREAVPPRRRADGRRDAHGGHRGGRHRASRRRSRASASRARPSTAQKVDPATGKYSTDKFTAVVRRLRAGRAARASSSPSCSTSR